MSGIMTFTLHLICIKSFNNYYISWMYPKFEFAETSPKFCGFYLQILSGKRQFEKGYCRRK